MEATRRAPRYHRRILWSSLYKHARSLVVERIRPEHGQLAYRIADSIASRLESRTAKTVVRLTCRDAKNVEHQAVYASRILSLLHIPRHVNPRRGYLLVVAQPGQRLKVLSASLCLSEANIYGVEPPLIHGICVLVSKKRLDREDVGELADRAIYAGMSVLEEHGLRRFVAMMGYDSRLDLRLKPCLVLLAEKARMADEISVVIGDGAEETRIRVPLLEPRWSLSDLPEKLAEELEDLVVKPIEMEANFAPKGMIIIGPPGVGKTVTAEAIAKALKRKILELTPSTYRSMWYGMTEKALTAILREACKRNRELVVLVDDAEFISSRTYTMHEAHVSEITTFLRMLQRPDHPFTVLTSNAPHLVDPALLRPGRIDITMIVGYPDREFRRIIAEKAVKRYNIKASEQVIEEAARISRWYSHAEVDALIRMAAAKGRGEITMETLEWAKKRIPINESERRSIQDRLRWLASRTQGMTITYIPSEEKI